MVTGTIIKKSQGQAYFGANFLRIICDPLTQHSTARQPILLNKLLIAGPAKRTYPKQPIVNQNIFVLRQLLLLLHCHKELAQYWRIQE